MTIVLGVDGCPGGWCAVALDVSPGSVSVTETQVLGAFTEVLESPGEVICVDIPIGLLDRPGQRECDVEARRMLGPGRAASVFPAPSRRALAVGDYGAASSMNFELTGRHLNKQSFNVAGKVREVDDVMKAGMQERVREVHPELCFWALNMQASMRLNKKTTAGRESRWRVLRRAFDSLGPNPRLPPQLKGLCGADDYVDALVAAWTAACVARGEARRIPAEPEVDERGLRMEMWLPG